VWVGWRLFETIAEAALGNQVFGVAGIGFDLFAERPDEVLDMLDLTGVLLSPNLGEERFAWDGTVRTSGQNLEEAIFGGGEIRDLAD